MRRIETGLIAFALLSGAQMSLADAASAQVAPHDRPPFAHPGQCFARVVEPARYSTVRDHVLVQPARTDSRVIPAQYRDEDRPVMLEPERRERFTVAAVCRDVTEEVTVRPPGYRTEIIPAQYRDVAETVMVQPARRYWKHTAGAPSYGQAYAGQTYFGQTQVTPTGEIVCLVEEPPVYQTVMRRVLVSPERQVRTPVPGETRLVTRRVVDQPERVEERVTPARWGTQSVRVMVSPERVERTDVAPVYRDVDRQVRTQPARSTWIEIACAAPPPPPPLVASSSPCAGGCDVAPPPPPPPAIEPCAPVACAGAPPPATPREHRDHRSVHAARSANPVAAMEQGLAARGYYKGPVDGLMTPAAASALHRFQADNHLPVGPLTDESASALDVG